MTTGQKKVALVTGCTTGGIGYEVAKAFEKRGVRVYAAARRVEAITNIEGLDIHKVHMDVLDEASVRFAVQTVFDAEGRIDYLFNNAGVGLAQPLIDSTFDQARHLLNTNIASVALVTSVVAPHMIRARSGSIINVGSVTAYMSTPFGGLYAASKAAVHSMSNTLRMELLPFNVKVVVVAPGAIKSNIGDNNLKGWGLPENSFYHQIREYVMARANASQAPGCTPTAEFANLVVNKAIKSNPPKYIDGGHMSTMFRIFMYMPRWFSEYFFAKRFGLYKLKALEIEAAKKK